MTDANKKPTRSRKAPEAPVVEAQSNPTNSLGLTAEQVLDIQKRFTDLCLMCEDDITGKWTATTQECFVEFCAAVGLDSAGLSPEFYQALAELQTLPASPAPTSTPSTSLTLSDYQAAADSLGVDLATIMGVCEIESNGVGFLPSGKVAILFQAHVFSRLTRREYEGTHPEISSRNFDHRLYRYGEAEHVRLSDASVLNRKAAVQSTAFGLFQVMGYNFALCGFASEDAFVRTMQTGERAQLLAFVALCKSLGADACLRDKDWKGFALLYNGPNYAANEYDAHIAAAIAKWNRELI